MKRNSLILFLFLVLGCCANYVQSDSRLGEAFQEQFKTENKRVRGALSITNYSQGLDSLTYDYYIHYLDSTKVPSAEGMIETIQSADEHYFKTKKNSFLIALLYRKERMIFVDDAYTNKLDTVYNIKENEAIPVLKEFSHKIKF
jgi:hypothetical protein